MTGAVAMTLLVFATVMLISSKSSEMGFITQFNGKPIMASRKKVFTFFSLGIICFTLAAVLIFTDPVIAIAKYRTRVAVNSRVHDLMKGPVTTVHISVYLFNVTNAKRFMAGEDEKLKVEEVGPFTYREERQFANLEIDEAAGVMRYSPRVNPVFMPEESIAHPKDVYVTMPSFSMMTSVSMMSHHPYLSRMAFNLLAKQINSKPMVSIDAHNYLWGYEDTLLTLGHTFMPSWIQFDTMGLLDRMYDKNLEYTLEVGANNEDKFLIKQLDGYAGLTNWDYEDPSKRTKCNSFINSYEGLVYSTDLTPETPLRIFRNVLCRMLELDYHDTVTMDYGPKALLYKISNRTFQNGPDKECTCQRGLCVDGISDLSPCFYGLPLALSNAHFLYGGPHLFERIEGLNPDEKKHGSKILVEPKLGGVLGTTFSMQVNIVIGDATYNEDAKRFSDMILPIGYFKIVKPEIPDEDKKMLYDMYVTGPYLVLALLLVLFILGISLLFHTARLLYWNWICNGQRGMEFQLCEDEKKMTVVDVDMPLMNKKSELLEKHRI